MALEQHQEVVLPEILTIAITAECNLNCRHCWVNAGSHCSTGAVPQTQVRRVVEDFARLGGKAVRFTGGEPLLHPEWFHLVAGAVDVGLKVFLQTNGTLLSRSMVHSLTTLELSQLNIQISFDGATAATHDLVRGAGAYAQALHGVEQLVSYGFGSAITLFMTEMEHNLQEVPELFSLAEQLQISSVHCGTLVQCGRGRDDVFVAPPGVEQYQALLQLYDENEQFRMLYDAIGNIAVLEWYLNPYDKPRCELGQNPYLTAAGRLYPCLMCHCDDYSVTGVFETSIKQALNAAEPKWRALRQISLERAASIAQCRSCELRGSCGGGCVGRAWGSYEDLFSPDDRCSLRRAVLAWTQKTTSLQDFCS